MKKKKLLIVRSAMGQGGADRITLTLLSNLNRDHYQISLLLMRRTGEFLSLVPKDITILGPQSSNLWLFLPHLIRSVKRVKPDVVFSIDGGTNVPAGIAAFLWPFRKWRLILSERNILFPPGKSKIKRALLVFSKLVFYRFADCLTAVSEGVQDDMHQKLWIDRNKILIVDNPIIDDNLHALAQVPVEHEWLSHPRTIPVIVHAGRFVYQKDHITLLQAFAYLKKRISVRLILLGDGPLHDAIANKIEELNLSDSVQMLGFDVNPFKYFAQCDLFVLSSVHEGMPGVLIQAMACGAPVVSTDCPSGPNEVITHHLNNGLLVPIRDPRALSDAMYSILADANLSATFRKNGPESVKKFAIQTAIKSYVKAIES